MNRGSLIGLLTVLIAAGAIMVMSWRVPGHSAGDRTVLNWLVPMQLDRPLLEKLAAQFNAENPDVYVQLTFVPGAQYHAKLKTLIASGHPPDLFYSGDVWAAYYQPFLLDLTPYFERDAKEVDIDDIYEPIWAACRTDGRYLFMPRWFSVALLYYNKTLFKEAGEPFPTNQWTWDDYIASAKRLTRTSEDGKTQVWGSHIVTGWWGEWLTLVRQSGGELFDPTMTRCLLDQPEAIRGMQKYVDKIYWDRISPPPGFGPDQGFASGKLAMELVGHTGNWTMYNQIPSLDWDIALLPEGPTPKNRSEVAIDAIGASIATKHPEECWRFLKFMMSPSSVQAHVDAGFLSIRKSVAKQTLLRDGYLPHPQHSAIAYEALAIADHGSHSPDYIEIALEVIQPEIDLMLAEGTHVDEHCRRAAKAANDFIATLGTNRSRHAAREAAKN